MLNKINKLELLLLIYYILLFDLQNNKFITKLRLKSEYLCELSLFNKLSILIKIFDYLFNNFILKESLKLIQKFEHQISFNLF